MPDEPLQHAVLVIADEQFGPIDVALTGLSPKPAPGPESWPSNGSVRVFAEVKSETPAEAGVKWRITVILEGEGGKSWRPSYPQASGESSDKLPADITGLRLYAEGESPIPPIGEPRIVLLPERPSVHQLEFVVPDDAAVLALVLPLAPPDDNGNLAQEPYWVLPLRGETPSLRGVATQIPEPGSSLSVVTDESQRANSASIAPQHSEPAQPLTLPEPPTLAPREPAIDAEIEARLETLLDQPMPAQATVAPSTNIKTPLQIEVDQQVAVSFAAGQPAHYYRLNGLQDAMQLTAVLLAATPDAGLNMNLSLMGDSKRISPPRRSVLEPLRLVGADFLLTLNNPGRKVADYKLVWVETGSVTPAREFEPNDNAKEQLLPSMAGDDRLQVLHGGLSGGDDVDFFILNSSSAAVATLELRSPTTAKLGSLRMHRRTGETVLYGGRIEGGRHVMQDVYLLPGVNLFSVRQGTGDYTVQATLQTRPGPEYEREPNDTAAFAHDLNFDQPRYGRFGS